MRFKQNWMKRRRDIANKIAKKEVNLHLINNMEGIQHVSVEGKFSMDFF